MFLRRTERTLTEYVKAQLLVSLIIAVSAGVVLWIYGVTGIFALGATYAVAFAAWVFLMEFMPVRRADPGRGAAGADRAVHLAAHRALGGDRVPRDPPVRGARGGAEDHGHAPWACTRWW